MFIKLRRRFVPGALALVVLLLFSLRSHAAEPQSRFEVHDVSVWMIDVGGKTANSKSAYPSALPVTVQSLRAAGSPAPGSTAGAIGFVGQAPGVYAPAAGSTATSRTARASAASRRAAPISLITFHGEPVQDLDVDVRTRSGSFLAHWPPGDGLPNRLRWFGTPPYNLVEKIDDEAELMFVDSDHWMAAARKSDALYIKRGARSERFLAYDVELKLDAPVRLEGGPDTYKVINTSETPLYDVVIARNTPEGFRVAWLDKLPPGRPAAAPPKPNPPKPAQAKARGIFDDAAAKANDAAASERVNKSDAAKLFGGLPGKAADAKAKEAATAKPDDAAKPEIKEKPEVRAQQDAAAKPQSKPPAKLFGGLPKQAPAANNAAAKPAAATPDAKVKVEPEGKKLFGGLPKKVPAAKGTAAAKPAAGRPPEKKLFGGLPTPEPAQGVEVTLSEPLAADSPEAAAQTTQSLVDRLKGAGLTADESELFVQRYGAQLFAGQQLVVACRLDRTAIDERVPLSVFPVPAKTVRVAMVFLRNADPQMGDEVARLVAALGDPQWKVREAAQKRLLQLGPVAFPALQKALNSSDPEIVIRSERILLKQNQSLTPQGGGRRGAALPQVRLNAVPVAAPAAPRAIINR